MSDNEFTNKELFDKGVAFLDGVDPKWRDKVDHGKFNFASQYDCVWGQLRKHAPFNAIAEKWADNDDEDEFPERLGFEGQGGGQDFHDNHDELAALWLAEITPEAPERFTHIFQPYFMVETDADGSNPKLSLDWDSCLTNTVDGNADPVDEYDPAMQKAILAAVQFMDASVVAPVNLALDSLTATK